MKRLVLAMVTAAVSVVVGSPAAWSFQPGERVTVGSINQSGIVIEDTGKLVKVRLDSQSGYSAGVGVWYDKEEHKVTGGTGGTTSAGAGTTSTGAGGNTSAGNGDGKYQPGKRVQIGNQTGTILEESGDNVKVHIDSSGYSSDVGVWFTKAQLNGTAGATAAPVSPRASASGYSTNSGRAGSAPGNQKTNPPIQAAQSAPATEKGVGAPPDGIYQCNKISGRSYIHIGTIEIRGGTYKGFSSQQGSFHPFSMDASGGIVWTGSLTGLPDGWKLKPAKYVGPDYKGHPLIRIYYTSDRGAAEVIDATKEK